MPLLIDTYNVLHVAGVLPPDLAGIDTASLVRLLQTSRYRRERAILVCDGTPPPAGPVGPIGPEGRIQVQYSGPDSTADDAIARLIGLSTEPRRLTVVSSDRRHVLAAARRRRCRTLSSEQFLAQLADDHLAAGRTSPTPPPPVTPLTRGEVQTWINEFGIDEDELAAASVADPAEKASGDDARSEAIEPADDPEKGDDGREGEKASSTASGPPLIPRSVLAEALGMIATHEEEEATRRRETPGSGDDPQDSPDGAASTAKPVPEADAPEQHPWRSFLTPELIAEAERTETEMDARSASAAMKRGAISGPSRDQRSRRPPRQPPRSDVMPPDVIAEAEALWQEKEDDEHHAG